MKPLDLPLAQLADLDDAYLPELAGQARAAEPVRRRWLNEARERGDALQAGLAMARLGINLLVQGAHRPAQAELRAARADLARWAAATAPAQVRWQLAVVDCAAALIEAQLSVPIDPPRRRAANALKACARAVAQAPDASACARDLAPWALATASTWLTLLDEAAPAAWAEVHAALQPTLDAALRAGDGTAARWLLDFIECVQRLGPLPARLGDALGRSMQAAVEADRLDLAQVIGPPVDAFGLAVEPWEAAASDRLHALHRACPAPLTWPGEAGHGAMGPSAAVDRPDAPPDGVPAGAPIGPGSGEALGRALLRVACGRAGARLPWSPMATPPGPAAWMHAGQGVARAMDTAERPRIAQIWLGLADRLPRPTDSRGQRLRLAAAQLLAEQRDWPAALAAMARAAQGRCPVNGAVHEAWMLLLQRLATLRLPNPATLCAPDRRRWQALCRWLATTAPLPTDPLDEARWMADLAALRGDPRESLDWRRRALQVAEHERGPASLDGLSAMQALRDTLAALDPDHPELEELHDEGVDRALRLCGPMSPEHWWWRGMRALWWNGQGHGQALADAAADAELALPLTARNGDADTCACLRLLIDVARSTRPPARLERSGWTPPAACRVQ